MKSLNNQVKYLRIEKIIKRNSYDSIKLLCIPEEKSWNYPLSNELNEGLWIKLLHNQILDITNKEQCEQLVGMKLKPLVIKGLE